MNKKIFLLVLLVVLSFNIYAYADENVLKLTILHTNDIHGEILTSEDGEGGSARIAYLVNQIRLSTPNQVFLVDAGDIATRGPYADVFKGELEVEIMNKMGYNAACIGNNEFKISSKAKEAREILSERIKQANFPWLAANVMDDETWQRLAGVEPYQIKDLAGVKVAFFGLTTMKSDDYTQTKNLDFLLPVSVAKKMVPELQKEADIIIGLTHLGVSSDELLAREVPGFAAIVGGDSHTSLYSPKMINGVPIVQAGEKGLCLGRLDLTFVKWIDGNWKLKDYKGELLPINKKIPEDEAVKEIIDSYLKRLKKAA